MATSALHPSQQCLLSCRTWRIANQNSLRLPRRSLSTPMPHREALAPAANTIQRAYRWTRHIHLPTTARHKAQPPTAHHFPRLAFPPPNTPRGTGLHLCSGMQPCPRLLNPALDSSLLRPQSWHQR